LETAPFGRSGASPVLDYPQVPRLLLWHMGQVRGADLDPADTVLVSALVDMEDSALLYLCLALARARVRSLSLQTLSRR
jgi:hypothetical protein